MENTTVVKEEELTPSQPQEGTPQEEPKKEDKVQPAQPGSKTEPTDLLKSLQKEREERRLAVEKAKLLEEELNTIKSSNPSEDIFSDEGQALKERIDSLKSEINSLRDERTLEKVYSQYPQLKELKEEFSEYKQDYPRHKLENVAKLFLSEKGLIESPRQGLEKQTGGDRTPQKTGMTSEEVADLRKNNYKKYVDMLKKDQIKIV